MNEHRLAEERSLALHREVVQRVTRDPALLDCVRERVQTWLRDGSVAASYANEWARLLAAPSEDLHATLLDDGESARALRQCTPFAGVVDPRTRWKIWREVGERLEASR